MIFNKKFYPDIRETLYTSTHKSGLKVFVLPKTGFTKSYAILGTKYGSVNNRFKGPKDTEITETPDGIAHYLEHKMFDQEDGSNVFDKFSKYGANANAFTGFTMTAYLFSATDHLYENLETLLDYTMHPYYTDETVAKEQGIIGQEIRMYEDDPGWNVYFNALYAMYQKHSVAIDIAGSGESIAKITKDTLYKCYNTFYHPSNMVFFAVGAFSPDKVGDYIEKYIPATENPGEITNYFNEEPKEIRQKYIEKYFDIGIPQFVVAFKDSHIPKMGYDYVKDDAVMTVLLELIAGKSSKLYEQLYSQGLINESFDASYEGELSYAFAAFSGESSDPKSVKSSILSRIAHIKEEGISKESLDRAKRSCFGKAVSLLDKQESFANTFVRFATKDADFLEYPKAITEITNDDIKNALWQLKPDKCVLSVALPKEVMQ